MESLTFTHCPRCCSEKIAFHDGKVYRCPECGFVYYHNVCAATACLIETSGGLLTIVRGKEPCKGKLHLPGGFVNPGEALVEGMRRECVEEIGFDPGPASQFFASFPNIYPYKGVVYNTCDCFFLSQAPNLDITSLVTQKTEISGLRLLPRDRLVLSDFAFDSVRRAVALWKEAA